MFDRCSKKIDIFIGKIACTVRMFRHGKMHLLPQARRIAQHRERTRRGNSSFLFQLVFWIRSCVFVLRAHISSWLRTRDTTAIHGLNHGWNRVIATCGRIRKKNKLCNSKNNRPTCHPWASVKFWWLTMQMPTDWHATHSLLALLQRMGENATHCFHMPTLDWLKHPSVMDLTGQNCTVHSSCWHASPIQSSQPMLCLSAGAAAVCHHGPGVLCLKNIFELLWQWAG